jgi:hypothetical protein
VPDPAIPESGRAVKKRGRAAIQFAVHGFKRHPLPERGSGISSFPKQADDDDDA